MAKIQQSALAHREIERQKNLGAKRRPPVSIDPQLEHRAQLPLEAEFVEILQKFKLCFNLLVIRTNYNYKGN